MKSKNLYTVRINGQVYRTGLELEKATQLRDRLQVTWGKDLIVTVDSEGLFHMTPYIAVLCATVILTILLLVWFLWNYIV